MEEINIKPGRTLVVGDIHGGLKALLKCLTKCKYNKEYDKLIFLGDYVDGWSESAELIDFLLDLEAQAIHKPVFLRGNHDEWCNEWMQTGIAKTIWLTQGGAATFESYMRAYDGVVPTEHAAFFYRLHNYYVDDQNRGFVHGGFHSRKGLGHEVHQSDYYWDRDLWNLVVMTHGRTHESITDSARRFEKHKEIYIGHTATTSWMCKNHYPEADDIRQPNPGPITIPMHRCNVWNMDTGGGWSGKLSIMDIDTKDYWQSDIVPDLYPEEKGRKGIK